MFCLYVRQDVLLVLPLCAGFDVSRFRMSIFFFSFTFFFFQAEDGIRDSSVTGVQTCALPISAFLKSAGLAMSKVPYRNLVEAANDLATGRIDVNVTAFAIVRPQIDAGKVKLLAVTNTARSSVLPDVPTVTEAGYPDLALDGLVGFFGPPTMPERIRDAIAADVPEAIDAAVWGRLSLSGPIPHFDGAFGWRIAECPARILASHSDSEARCVPPRVPIAGMFGEQISRRGSRKFIFFGCARAR